jgi:DNA-binding CsgD family transcriptional regulator
MHQGLVIVDAAAKIVSANAAAQRLIGANDGLRVRHRKLETDSPSDTEALRHAIKAAVSCVSGGFASVPDLVIVNRRSRCKLVIWIAPISSGALYGEQDPLVAVFVVDAEAGSQSPEKVLRKLFGLTPAESRLANALMRGDLTSASEEFGISRNTARSQLQSIFSKTGTSKQGELIRVLCQVGCIREQGS